jgi:hypothetical protein
VIMFSDGQPSFPATQKFGDSFGPKRAAFH